MTHDRSDQLILIGGAPRSGTTLVQTMLDAHDAIAGGPEFDHLPAIMDVHRRLLAGQHSGRLTVFGDDEHFRAATAAYVTSLLLPFGERQGARLVAEKTPFNVLYFGDMLKVLPRARLIWVVRDPRAVVASMLQVGARARAKGAYAHPITRDVVGATQSVRACMDAGWTAQNEAPDRVLRVHYEDLVTDPDAATKRIAAHCGVAWVPQMAHPESVSAARRDQVDGVFYTDAMLAAKPTTERLDAWRSTLDGPTLRAIHGGLGDAPYWADMGYELPYGTLDRAAWWQARAAHATAPLRSTTTLARALRRRLGT